MKPFTSTTLLAILVSGAITGIITLNVQQVYAPRSCAGCVEFKKLTHELEKNVIDLIGDPNQGPQPHLRELLDTFDQKVVRLLFTDPWLDQVRTLLQTYEQDVLAVFTQPPEPDKHQLHDQIKEFRQLTKAFGGSINQLTAASIPPN
jgi:hypothetical protein